MRAVAQQVYIISLTSAFPMTCVTFADSPWEMDKWPLFVQVRCSHDVRCIHK